MAGDGASMTAKVATFLKKAELNSGDLPADEKLAEAEGAVVRLATAHSAGSTAATATAANTAAAKNKKTKTNGATALPPAVDEYWLVQLLAPP